MDKKALRADILLLLTAAIWGFGFVAQRSGMEHIGPFAFNGIRFILGSLFLLPYILIKRRSAVTRKIPLHRLFFPALAAGGILFTAVIIQQFGIIFTTAGNAGFITGFYVVLTPVIGNFLGRKTGIATWIGSILTLTGLYFISVAGSRGSINPGDILIFVSTFFWAAHILIIDRLMNTGIKNSKLSTEPQPSPKSVASTMRGSHLDPVELSSGQFAVCGILSLLGAFLAEPHIGAIVERIDPSLLGAGLFEWKPFPALVGGIASGVISFPVDALIPLLYGGLGSVGIAYTLQVVAQRDAPPAHATIIMCFEGSFAALGGVLLLSEKLGVWTAIGFFIMLTGMLVTQWEIIIKNR